MTSLPKSPEARKQLGAWYTGLELVQPLVQWALRDPDDRVLDPACGDGAFLAEATRRLRAMRRAPRPGQISGFDINAAAVSESAVRLSAQVRASATKLVCSDFFSIQPPLDVEAAIPPVDVVIGNPPYVRFQSFTGDSRRRAVAQCRRAGVSIGGLASSWAPFVVHSTNFLAANGRLALVLPEELAHASYAAPVRDYLRRMFRLTGVVSFARHVFPDSQERVVLLVADGFRSASPGELRLTTVERPESAMSIDALLYAGMKLGPNEPSPAKWTTAGAAGATETLATVAARRRFVPLLQVGKAGIGFVSGANKFFVLTNAEATAAGIPQELLGRALTAARHCAGATVTRREMAALVAAGERVLLLQSDADHPAVRRHLRNGERAGIPNRYKCRVREPWHRVPGVVEPDAFLTYMSDLGPRLALNRARASCSNTLLAVRLRGLGAALQRTMAWAFYSSVTQLSAEFVGRSYGGGVLKLEPSEADRLLVPGRELLVRLGQRPDVLRSVNELLRAGRREEAECLVDEVLVGQSVLRRGELALIRSALCKMRARRLGARKAEADSYPITREPKEEAVS